MVLNTSGEAEEDAASTRRTSRPASPNRRETSPLSTASTSNEPGPDLADYPMDTVPNKVDQLFRAQLFHDRKQFEERMRMSPEQRSKTP